jgi:hypothetical protein
MVKASRKAPCPEIVTFSPPERAKNIFMMPRFGKYFLSSCRISQTFERKLIARDKKLRCIIAAKSCHLFVFSASFLLCGAASQFREAVVSLSKYRG